MTSNSHSNDDRRPDEQGEVLGAGAPREGSSTEKEPEQWATGDEPMTGAQRSYLDTLAREAGETVPADLTKAEASAHIDRLQGASDRAGSETRSQE